MTMNRGQLYPMVGWLALLAATACGSPDLTLLDVGAEEGEASADERDLGPVRAALNVEEGDLVVSLENRGNHDASVSLRVFVTSNTHNTSNPAGDVAIAAGESLRVVVPASELEGFDVAGSEWLRAELHYGFELDDGSSGKVLTALAARDGLVVPHAEAIERGYHTADTVLEGVEIIEKAGSFVACFRNRLTLGGSVPNDGLTPNLAVSGANNFGMRGQYFEAHYPRTATGTPTANGYLDSAGCTPAIARRTNDPTERWKFRIYAYTFQNPVVILGLINGVIPSFTFSDLSVPGTLPPAPENFELPAGNERSIQAAVLIANNTVLRVKDVLGVSPGASTLTVSPTTGDTKYCPSANSGPGCTVAHQLLTNNGTQRVSVAHETGHWIHISSVGYVPHDYDYSHADAGNPSVPPDGSTCQSRRTLDLHSPTSIEWESVAHVEGIATFFGAVTYNNVSAGADCSINGNNCESVGKLLGTNGCVEWTNSQLFPKVGNEADWTKMYWDYVTDHGGQSFNTYMLAEKDVTDGANGSPKWPADGRNNHYTLIWNALKKRSTSLGNAWREAAQGNIFDGPVNRPTP